MRSAVLAVGAVLALVAGGSQAHAAPFSLGPPSIASSVSPFPPGCGGPGEAFASSVVYQNAEDETRVVHRTAE
jgi:hypothetical protein